MDPEHAIGSEVFLKTDQERLPRMVTGYIVRPTGVLYLLSSAATETEHYAIEIEKEKHPNGTAGFKR